MKNEIDAEVVCLSKVLEGEGKIRSSLEDSQYEEFGISLVKSIAEIDQPECSACIDGRRCICQFDGSEVKLRPKKAGGGVSTLAMLGMGDRAAINYLAGNTRTSDDIYEFAANLQENLGNKESGHNDCGAAKGLIMHVKSVSESKPDSPAVKLVTAVMSNEAPSEDAAELTDDVIKQAKLFAEVLEESGWNGEEYVRSAAQKDPSAVEKLEVDENDPVGGHAEDAIVIVDGPVDEDDRPLHTIDEEQLYKLTGRRAFIVNLNEMRRDASHLSVTPKLFARLLTAGLLHLAGGVYKNLGDGSHPVFVVRINQ